MKLYVNTKKLSFDEENNLVEHEIILGIQDSEFCGCDYIIELPDDDKFVEDTLRIEYKKDKDGKNTEEIENKMFRVREEETWFSYPLYEIIDNKIVDFDYTRYSYFSETERRVALAGKVNELYNPSSEAKLHRKILKKILDYLGIVDESFEKYNNKIEMVIEKNPK